MPAPDHSSSAATKPRRSGWPIYAGLALLLSLHFALAVGSKSHESTTSDELVHVTGGFTYWTFNDYRLHPENGNLPERWAALPAYLAGAKFPSLDQVYWRTSDSWVMGHEFFYETGEDHFPRLMAARAMIALFSVGIGLMIFCWSRALFGVEAAFLSVTLFAFCPSFLAHGALATSDVCMAFFFLASVGLWWRHLHDPRPWLAGASAIVFGLACVAKFSAVLLLPMFALLAVVRIFVRAPMRWRARSFATRAQKAVAVAMSAGVHAAVAVVMIWAFYGFRYSAFGPDVPPADQFIRRWDLIDQNIGLQGRLVEMLAHLHALPEAFLYGYAYVIESAQSRSAFLNGEYSLTGWWSFFPWAFALKATIAVLAICVAGGIAVTVRWIRRAGTWRTDLYRVLPLVSLFVVYWAFSLTTHLNIGERHILPTYPVIFIAAGVLVVLARGHRLGRAALLLAAVAQVYEAGGIAPHFLAYFNPIWGGPSQGYRHLVDSSLDWGQDLPGLQEWLQRNAPHEAAYLSYFGTGEPDYYRIRAHRLVMINGFKLEHPLGALGGGVYCISATCLQQVYSPERGPWTLAQEKSYQALRESEPALLDYSLHPEHRGKWEAASPGVDWRKLLQRYEELRFARLCHYLRARTPDAQIGYSINIYRLSAAEVGAITGSLSSWTAAMHAAVSLHGARP